MKPTGAAAVVLLFLSTASGQVAPFSDPEPVGFGVAATEAFGALLGGGAALAGVYALSASLAGSETNRLEEADEVLLGFSIGLYVVPAGFAGGTSLFGLLLGERGGFGPSYVGALLGLPAGMAVAAAGLLGDQAFGTGPWLTLTGGAIGVALPTFGAVWAYNSSRPPSASSPALDWPALGLHQVNSDTGDALAIDCRLLSVRF
ncbi:MAG: hypothetical protein JSU73_09620 [candidate division WOR-3 bacterium]|nr:MAG: hypothetical protein JSU73_09620 [candidate division WOR-3 bacterium]